MFCFSWPRQPVSAARDEDLLMSIQPGSLQIPSYRGHLFYRPPRSCPHHDPLSSRRRTRSTRPLDSVFDGQQSPLAPLISRTSIVLLPILARSRESAKRILRLQSSHVFPPSFAESQQQITHETAAWEEMTPADGAREQPAPGFQRVSDLRRAAGSMQQSRVDGLRPVSHRMGAKDATGAVSAIRDEKPIASGNGLAISISLAEPILYLQGYDSNDSTSSTTTMLRGSLHLRVTKQAKLKSISLTFRGRSETEWPEGIPPRKTEFRDTEIIMNHTWPFFNAQFPQAETSYCADIVQLVKAPSVATKELGVTTSSFDLFQRSSSPRPGLSSVEARRLSLQAGQSRSFNKGDNIPGAPSVSQKGFKVFHPGDYIYHFELPVDSRLPESINVELGAVKYELEALVERSGAFRPNLVGCKDLMMVRSPAEGSLEQIEPIAISRNWEDQLHYDIVISGKSFPLGANIPIAFKLTPLAKVQCHRIKVLVTENIQYFTANKRVHRLEPTRKLQLFEKRADGLSTSTYPGSTIRVTSGGGIAWDHREAAARGEEDVPRDSNNLLGNLEQDSASIGPTEMEISVKLPGCHEMKEKAKNERIHFDTTHQNIQVNHWIKIVLRLSRPDERDSAKRRHFEISIDSPFHILSCRATAANTSLPAYSSGRTPTLPANEFDCGCPGAAIKKRNPGSNQGQGGNTANPSTTPTTRLPTQDWTTNSAGLIAPSPAHVHEPSSGVQDLNSGPQRPIHLVRNPSFNPPAFGDEEPPPPLMTPPPNYEHAVSGDSRNALADYFSRLADEMGDEEEPDGTGRVDVPLTPGGRINRSMDASRSWLPLGAPAAD